MVGALLGLPEEPPSDHAADALAVAICHASQSQAMLAAASAAAAGASGGRRVAAL
jgi:Holliday junction resolvasome RuvABC endonuclease subunit